MHGLAFFHGEIATLLGPWGTLLAVVAVALVVAVVGGRAAAGIIKATTARTKTRIDDIIAASLWPAIAVLAFAGLTWLGLGLFREFLPPWVLSGWGVIQTILIVFVVAFSVVRLARSIFDYQVVQKPHVRPMASLGGRAVSLVVWVTALLVLLRAYHVDVNPILASLGIATLAVGLALQDTLANFFSGIWIQASKTFRPTHFVRVEELGVDGFIDEIGWRATRVRTLAGNIVVVPNRTMAGNTITDFTLPEPKMGTNFTFHVGYEVDPQQVLKVCLEEMQAAVKENPTLLVPHPEPAARLNGFTERGFEIWCGFWVPYYWTQWNAAAAIRMRFARRFRIEAIRLPYVSEEGYPMPERHVVLERERLAAQSVPPPSPTGAGAGVVGKGPGPPVSQEG